MRDVLRAFALYLTLRPDLRSLAWRQRLARYAVPREATPFDVMENRAAGALGYPLHRVVRTINRTPISVGLFNQVYAAELADGSRAVIKIQRPGIRAAFDRSERLIQYVGWLVGYTLVAEFAEWMLGELDLTREARGASILKATPRIQNEYTREGMLVAEYVGGGTLLAGYRADDPGGADLFIRDLLHRALFEGVFHAHPSPDHVVLFSDSVCYLDAGVLGALSSSDRFHLAQLLDAVARGNAERSARGIFAFGERHYERALGVYLKRDVRRAWKGGEVLLKIKENIVAEIARECAGEQFLRDGTALVRTVMSVTKRLGIQLSGGVKLFLRTLEIYDELLLGRVPSYRFVSALRTFFTKYPLSELEADVRDAPHAAPDVLPPKQPEDWEIYRERASIERERELQEAERAHEYIAYLADRYDDVRASLAEFKKLKL